MRSRDSSGNPFAKRISPKCNDGKSLFDKRLQRIARHERSELAKQLSAKIKMIARHEPSELAKQLSANKIKHRWHKFSQIMVRLSVKI
jgi:hypothetical protein